MSKKKFYGVKVGLKPGVYLTWADCLAQTKGVTGALFKSFDVKDEAEAWVKEIKPLKSMKSIRVYVDGSFVKAGDPAGWGWVAVENGVELARGSGVTAQPALSRNIDGELVAALEGAKWLAKKEASGVIVHDYTGIAHWALGEWKAKSEIAIWYQKEIESYIEFIEFEKVAAHSGEKWNDLVDELAKKALDSYAKNEKAESKFHYSTLGNAPEASINYLIRYSIENPEAISLAAGLVDPKTFPVKTLAKITQEVFEESTIEYDLQYNTTQGEFTFRNEVANYLKENFEENHDFKNIIIGNGSQQLLYLFAEIGIEPGDIVLIENPSYYVYMDTLKQFGAKLISIDCDDDGPLTKNLSDVLNKIKTEGDLKKLKAFYTVSYCQNPTGRSHSLKRKIEITQLINEFQKQAPFYMIEDAAYRELSFETPVPSYGQLGIDTKWYFYCGTFSKSLAPGLRIGYGIASSELIEKMVNLKGSQDFGTSNLNQSIVKKYLESKYYVEHLAFLRNAYLEKAKFTEKCLEKYLAEHCLWSFPMGGLYFWIELKKDVDTGFESSFFKQCLKEKVVYVPGVLFFEDKEIGKNSFRITFAFQEKMSIEKGIKRLSKVLIDQHKGHYG